MPDKSELDRMYCNEYFEEGGSYRPTTPGGYAEKEREVRQEARGLLTHLRDRTGKLLEIGCAAGFFLDEARARGFDVVGLELNRKLVDEARRERGLDVKNVSVLDAEFPPRTFDVVVANRVLEHIPCLNEALGSIARWLKPGGVLLVSGPFEQMTRSWLWHYANRVRRQRAAPVPEPPYHVHGFTKASWRAALQRASLRAKRLVVTPGTIHLRVSSVKDAIAWPLELAGWVVDRMRGGGSFMVALAERDER
jgi:2-polyprenyl-3-methyl-5-hydroxy-6-metoxy-1,4-benzoquinol methylase